MSELIRIRKGLNIKLQGEAVKSIAQLDLPEIFAIHPPDFKGIKPRLSIKVGDEVLSGTPLFYDKKNDKVNICSPVSGQVAEITYGEKREILSIQILPDKTIKYALLPGAMSLDSNKEHLIEILLKFGAWPFIRQRPYGIVANPNEKPKSIFISAFDSHPLAPDLKFILKDSIDYFQNGIEILRKISECKIHLNIEADTPADSIFYNIKGVQINKISGPHPAGNVGIQIHHIDPLNKGEVVWYINPQDVLIIGKLFSDGIYDASRVIAVTGSQVVHPQYYKTIIGCSLKNIINDAKIKEGTNRFISGNVLTGSKISPPGFLGYYDSQITIIPEGHESEFMGWLSPGFNKFSMSRTFFSWLTPNKKFNLNSNLHGEERPFVMTGQYEKVLPMDIYPVQLLKSILIEDVDMMEKLGIYEVAEEDFALCEFVCTSKIKSQDIIRRGLEMIQKEFS